MLKLQMSSQLRLLSSFPFGSEVRYFQGFIFQGFVPPVDAGEFRPVSKLRDTGVAMSFLLQGITPLTRKENDDSAVIKIIEGGLDIQSSENYTLHYF